MADHDIFVAAERPVGEVLAVIETELGAVFSISEDPDPIPALVTGATKVFFYDSHEFDDDRDFAVSQYRYWINVHDSARDEQRQLAIAQRVFDAMKARAWPAMLSFNLQDALTIYP